MHITKRLFALTLAWASAACAEEVGGIGSLKVSISGEQAALEGYPTRSGEHPIAFADGWSVQFQKILISLTGFELKASSGDDEKLAPEPVIADLHRGKPELWRFENLSAKRWDRVGYKYEPPTANVHKANDVDDADIERMADAGYSLYIEAIAQKGDRKLALQWGFPFALTHTQCVNGLDGTKGYAIAEQRLNEAQITVHLDHLFLDSFATEDAQLRFDAMAAVAPTAGPLLLEDLAKQDNLTDLKASDGKPLELGYDPGSAFDPVPKNLEQYVIAAGSTTGHWNGEGHCVYTRR